MASQLVLSRAVQRFWQTGTLTPGAIVSLVPNALRVLVGQSAADASQTFGAAPADGRFRKRFATSAVPPEPRSKQKTDRSAGGVAELNQSMVADVEEISKAIKAAEKGIKKTSKAICSATDVQVRTVLEGKESQLRDEAKQLREKEKKLRKMLSDQKSIAAGTIAFRNPFLITESIEFTREVLQDGEGNEHAMMVAPSVKGSSVVGPVYLTEASLSTIKKFVDNKTIDNSLVFMGPPKSSKTIMLHQVLPHLVVASQPAAEPVFARIVFMMNTNPEHACLHIRAVLRNVCEAYGIEAVVPADIDLSTSLPGFARNVATGLHVQGRCLWLLIDESHAPLWEACDRAEKLEMVRMYKSLVVALSDIGCCAFTGSSMVTFLHSMRDQSPEEFDVFNTAEYVLLGHNVPSQQWELRIATSLIESMKEKQDSNWLKIFGPFLTPELTLSALRSKPELFTVRPALIYLTLQNLSRTRAVTVETSHEIGRRLEESLKCSNEDMKCQLQYYFVIALHELRELFPFLTILHRLSNGEIANGDDAAALFLPDFKSYSKFAAMLCGLPDWVGAVRPRLLPPYAHYCSKFISEHDGQVALKESELRSHGLRETSLSDKLVSTLIMFANCNSLFDEAEMNMIGQAVSNALLRSNIGVMSADGKTLLPVQNVFQVPNLAKLYHQSLRSQHEEKKYQRRLAAFNTWVASGSQGAPPESALFGHIVLMALRNSVFRMSNFVGEALSSAGWRPAVLEQIVIAFAKCAIQTRWKFSFDTRSGMLKLDKAGTAEATKLNANHYQHKNWRPRPASLGV